MPSNDGHVHWMGADDEDVIYLGQVLEIIANTEGDPEGGLRIRVRGNTDPGVFLPVVPPPQEEVE